MKDMEINIDSLLTKAHVTLQSVAVIFLGWLATSISSLDVEIKELNAKMVAVVEITRYHEARIVNVERESKEARLKLQDVQLQFYEELRNKGQ